MVVCMIIIVVVMASGKTARRRAERDECGTFGFRHVVVVV